MGISGEKPSWQNHSKNADLEEGASLACVGGTGGSQRVHACVCVCVGKQSPLEQSSGIRFPSVLTAHPALPCAPHPAPGCTGPQGPLVQTPNEHSGAQRIPWPVPELLPPSLAAGQVEKIKYVGTEYSSKLFPFANKYNPNNNPLK